MRDENMSDMIERRKHVRYRFRLDVRLKLSSGVQLAAEIFNISAGGCLLASMVKLEVDETFEITLPSMPGVALRARVVRTRPVALWFATAVMFEPRLTDYALEELASRMSEDTRPPSDIL